MRILLVWRQSVHSIPCSAQSLTPVPCTSNICIFSRLPGSRHQHRALNAHCSFGSWSGELLGKGTVRQGGEETSGGMLKIKSHVGTWGSIPTGPEVVPQACLRVVPPGSVDASLVEGPSWDTSVFYRNSLPGARASRKAYQVHRAGPLGGPAPLISISRGSQA